MIAAGAGADEGAGMAAEKGINSKKSIAALSSMPIDDRSHPARSVQTLSMKIWIEELLIDSS